MKDIVLFEYGDEGGGTEGIKLFKGNCKRLENINNLPLPHIGFNVVKKPNSLMWKDINENSNFYKFIKQPYFLPLKTVEKFF